MDQFNKRREDLEKADKILGVFGPHRIQPKMIGNEKMNRLADGVEHVEPVREECPIDQRLKKTMTVIFDSKTDLTFNSRINLGINHHETGVDANPDARGKMAWGTNLALSKGEANTEKSGDDQVQRCDDDGQRHVYQVQRCVGNGQRLLYDVERCEDPRCMDQLARKKKDGQRRVEVIFGELWEFRGMVTMEVREKKRTFLQKIGKTLKRFFNN